MHCKCVKKIQYGFVRDESVLYFLNDLDLLAFDLVIMLRC